MPPKSATRRKDGKPKQPRQKVVRGKQMASLGVQYVRPDHMNEACKKYATALLDPFNPKALGARVPDEYAFPTSTVAMKQRVVLGTNGTGDFECIFMPNAKSFATMGTGIYTGQSQYFVEQTLGNYRIVGFGIRAAWLIGQNQVSGEVAFATVPSSHYVLPGTIGGQGAGGTAAANYTRQAILDAMSVPYTGTGATAVVNFGAIDSLPWSTVRTVSQSHEQLITINGRITSPEAYRFRQSADRKLGFDIVAQTSAAYVTSGDASYLSCHGWNDIIIVGTGLPANTNVLQVELVVHYEGTQQNGVNGGTMLSMGAPSVAASPLAMGEILGKAASSPWVRFAIDAAKTAVALL